MSIYSENTRHTANVFKCVLHGCRSQQGVVPSAHLADGRMVLVMIKNCNMLRYLHFLVLLARHGISTGMLPCVEVVAVSDVKVCTTWGWLGYK